MKRTGLIVLLLCCLLAFSGCRISSRETAQGTSVVTVENPVGEEAAKAAGLALIEQAFSIVPSKNGASVTYRQVEGAADKNYYIVFVGGGGYESCKAFAHVRAYTGEAYRAERSLSSVPMTDEQRQKAESLGATMEEAEANFSGNEGACMIAANAFVESRFKQNGEVRSVAFASSETDSEQFPVFSVWCDAEMADGTVLSVGVCWPQATVYSVGVG